ncbi:uroporphyrinogen-III C-methyltransferase [Sporofaciens sp. SGI.106]|uniref:uroporphyrinogen-III C-methyltransferase n=1 Tax=Sporofaciens sp. SGI.106 TaxID=3420568 RepID=UPI003D04B71A
MKETGKVWLAGAGPGDEGLLTVKTRQVMDEADVVVYDALVSMEILSQIPVDKEMIYVGKRAGHHPVPQNRIEEILVEKAKEGKNVLRLKGGDPFIFGRGGEEAEALIREGISFEIIPGVTSACAVPAYAGIPLTHRDYVSSFHVVTAHPRKDGNSRIDYEALVRAGGTCVFLMGVSSLASICNGLMEAGMSGSMPAAVLEKGTTAKQRRVVSTVAELQEAAAQAQIATPAIIIVGQVCELADTFAWSEKRVLGGRRFLITRPRERASELAGRLRRLGAQVIELPSIQTRPLEIEGELKAELEKFGTGTDREEAWLLFTSPAGVKIFFEKLRQMRMDIRSIIRKPAKVCFAAIGSATGRALTEHGIIPDVIPEKYDAGSLGMEVAKKAMPGSEILILRAREGSGALIPPMREAGLDVKEIPLYETVYEIRDVFREQIESMLLQGEIDAVTFTSASTVKGFVEMFKEQKKEICDCITAVCIGEQTAEEAGKHGMKVEISKQASMDSMVEKLIELYQI